ncbi:MULTISPECIES: TetR/AcrR family transcriptional regulator [unclassified Streptomyces]|uniref:TetR/AcrR family transcriptional regulator n=1 Tax=unclassified Streptomyces TaxID=2593676 RepID=UPI000CD5A32D|nr:MULTISPECIES: TetR/AcrR family transcriptional regulator [unclassified Streptomyces]
MSTAHSGSGDVSRSMELLWRGKEPTGRGPRPGLSLEGIVTAAVTLADREGLEALSMRKVAAELGVGTMSLYRYVPGKGELLDLMLDHVVGTGDEHAVHLDGLAWREGLEAIAEGTWELYTAHPWLLQVNQSRPVLGPGAMASLDHTLRLLDGLGLTTRERVGMILTVEHFVAGSARTHVLQQRVAEETGVSDEEFWAAQAPAMETAMASGAFPQVAGLDEQAFAIGGLEMMRFGLGPLLDGLAGIVAAAADRPQPPQAAPGCD